MSMLSRRSLFLEVPAVVVVLLAFWLGMVASLRGKSLTLDEGVHLSAGYVFWRYNDYRFNPENGNLPERVMALPLLLGHYRFPEDDVEAWRNARKWDVTWSWFYELGNDADAMMGRGRAAVGLLAVASGVLVWSISRQLFGQIGGMLSLLLYVLSPTVLANGALMTSDMAGALFFLAATWGWWRMLHNLSATRVLLSGVAMGALFLSKMSAVLIVPIVFALWAARLLNGEPLSIKGFGFGDVRDRGAQLMISAGVGLAHAMIVAIMIWGFHGFRYTATAPARVPAAWTDDPWELVLDKPVPGALLEKLELGPTQRSAVQQIFARENAAQNNWSMASIKALEAVRNEALTAEQAVHLDRLRKEPSPMLVGHILETCLRYHLLPEAYIYGYAHVWRYSRQRAAFFNGEYGMNGWRTFFPYTFLVKTPLSVFVLIILAIAAAVHRCWKQPNRSRFPLALRTFYQTLPLSALFAVYWSAAILSHINIGHRHILPTYPPLFVLCGAAASWLDLSTHRVARNVQRRGRVAALACGVASIAIVLLAAEIVYRFPNYLAYFNGLVKPRNAYRHLVDSSLDWGQDLPGVRRYIETRHPTNPIYLSYFGFGSPAYYHVPAIHSYSSWGSHPPPPMQVLKFPASEFDALLSDFITREPQYDVIGKTDEGDTVIVFAVKKARALRLSGGTYFVSATLLQTVTQPALGAFGPWNMRLENAYQSRRHVMTPLLSDDTGKRAAAFEEFPTQEWFDTMRTYEYLRFYRLAAFLRRREPDDNVGFSILVYHLTDADVMQALEGPPPELGRDVMNELFGQKQ